MSDGHLEIEHKFVVDDQFDQEAFYRHVRILGPKHEFTSDVVDTYYFTPRQPSFVLRHRIDDKLQQFTIKSLGHSDSAVRTEINLHLDSRMNQTDSVGELCRTMGVSKQARLTKKIRVFEFPDAEIVYYEAKVPSQTIRCVEFEALERRDSAKGRSIIERYEKHLGFQDRQREHHSLFELLILPELR